MADYFIPHPKNWADSLPDLKRRNADLDKRDNLSWSKESPYKDVSPFKESALDVQIGGEHYRNCKIQPIEFIHANKLDFIQGCVVKYITRAQNKGRKEDVLKVVHYARLLLELEYGVKSTFEANE